MGEEPMDNEADEGSGTGDEERGEHETAADCSGVLEFEADG